jgi:hypothetical protein
MNNNLVEEFKTSWIKGFHLDSIQVKFMAKWIGHGRKQSVRKSSEKWSKKKKKKSNKNYKLSPVARVTPVTSQKVVQMIRQ